MKQKNYLLYLTLLLTITIGSLGIFHVYHDKNTKWVDIKYLYTNFKLKKELETKFELTRSARQSMLDSLELNVRNLYIVLSKTDKRSIADYEKERTQFLLKKQHFSEDNEMQKKDYEEQIIQQLNQYVKDYALKNKIDFIYGADGSGVLMYASDQYNITNIVMEYVNERFDGNKK